jgi:uncharacterized protein YijF (DUF1287 family)
MNTTTPSVRAHQLQQVLDNEDSVIVWLVGIDDVDVAEAGLTRSARTAEGEGRIKVLVTYDEALDYLLTADGDVRNATGIANAVIERLFERGQL